MRQVHNKLQFRRRSKTVGATMEKIKLKINGQEIEAAPGKTILEVVRENGLDDIPTLCHSQDCRPTAPASCALLR